MKDHDQDDEHIFHYNIITVVVPKCVLLLIIFIKILANQQH